MTSNPGPIHSVVEFHDKHLQYLYSSPNILKIIKLKIMRWAGHKARKNRKEIHWAFRWESQKKETTKKIWT
jgi:hypothetical protein